MKALTIIPMSLLALSCAGDSAQLASFEEELQASPAGAVAVPADYDGDGYTDIALKGSNGIWYLDVAACSGGRCLGPDGFGGRWDFAYPGYGDVSSVPVPADYDGDRRADLAVKNGLGKWGIDYASNGFGVFDVEVYGYGDASAVPVPADYDGDGRADLSVKNSSGQWLIDYAHNGFNGWDPPNRGCPGCPQLPAIYGGATAVPVPADYNGDGRADLSVKTAAGEWYIDFSNTTNTGFGAWNPACAGCMSPLTGYGDATAVPVPFNYDPSRDNKADLAVKDSSGTWFVNYANDGFGSGWNASAQGYGGSWSKATPGDYDKDGLVDLSVEDTGGSWYIDQGSNGWSGWDPVPGTTSTSIHNPGRVLINPNQPHIEWTRVYEPGGPIAPLSNGHYQLKIGVRYTAAVRINPGNVHHSAGIEVNPDLRVPASLNLVNPTGSTAHIFITATHTRRFGITCSQPGSFPLGFLLRDSPTRNVMNPDYGIRVACTADQPGLYGVVTARRRDSNGRYYEGPAVSGASVTVPGHGATTTDSNGRWSLPGVTGGPHRVTVSLPSQFSPTVAVNVRVPTGSGLELHTPLEEPFSTLASAGMVYSTYIDYSRGRTIFHTVQIDTNRNRVKLDKSAMTTISTSEGPLNVFKTMVQLALDLSAPVMINGGYFDLGGVQGEAGDTPDVADDTAVGYFRGGSPPSYAPGYVPSLVNKFSSVHTTYAAPGAPNVLAPKDTLPLFGITGTGINQTFSLFLTQDDFLSTSSTEWKQTASGPIFDQAAPLGVTDFTYAVQAAPILLTNGAVIARDLADSSGSPDMGWARTAVGINSTGDLLYLVVADGEGLNGGQGATFNQLGEFFRDVLDADSAVNFDGGLSTEMVLQGASRRRNVNTITGEDSAWDVDRSVEGEIIEQYFGAGGSPGGVGSVFNYLIASP